MGWFGALLSRLTGHADETAAIPCPRCHVEIAVTIPFARDPQFDGCPYGCALTDDERIDITNAANREHAQRTGI